MTSRPSQGNRYGSARAHNAAVHVLVVEDDASIAELVALALRADGWDVHLAHDGLTALRQVRAVHPDVVVLDMMLPGVDCLEVMRQLRCEGNDVPVLFSTQTKRLRTGQLPSPPAAMNT